MKLEAEIQQACFIGPKTYGYIDKNGNETLKIKGFDSSQIKYEDLLDQLNPRNVKTYNMSQFLNRAPLNMALINQTKQLRSTINTKRAVLLTNGIISGTRPYRII